MQVIRLFRHAESLPFLNSYYLFTLLFLSKQTRHGSNIQCVPLATDRVGHTFFNYSNTNEDIVTKFEQGYVRCVRNEEECVCSVCL
jgi:hypothetical protein